MSAEKVQTIWWGQVIGYCACSFLDGVWDLFFCGRCLKCVTIEVGICIWFWFSWVCYTNCLWFWAKQRYLHLYVYLVVIRPILGEL